MAFVYDSSCVRASSLFMDRVRVQYLVRCRVRHMVVSVEPVRSRPLSISVCIYDPMIECFDTKERKVTDPCKTPFSNPIF